MGAPAAIGGGGGAQHPYPLEATALIVILKKENKKNADEYFSCSFYAF